MDVRALPGVKAVTGPETDQQNGGVVVIPLPVIIIL
jgi:hypothetical protein